MNLANIMDPHIPFVIITSEGMSPTPDLEMFFQDQDPLAFEPK